MGLAAKAVGPCMACKRPPRGETPPPRPPARKAARYCPIKFLALRPGLPRHPDCVEYLVTNGADPLLTDERRHNTCLHFSALYGHSECVHKLLGSRAAYRVQVRAEPGRLAPLGWGAGAGCTCPIAARVLTGAGYRALCYRARARGRCAGAATISRTITPGSAASPSSVPPARPLPPSPQLFPPCAHAVGPPGASRADPLRGRGGQQH